MKFDFIDEIIEMTDGQILAQKRIDPEDEYLKDHFPAFPIMPGVLMLETMVQAALKLVAKNGEEFVLGSVKAVKYGAMVMPGDTLQVEVKLTRVTNEGFANCRGKGIVIRNNNKDKHTAVSGRFTLRPAQLT